LKLTTTPNQIYTKKNRQAGQSSYKSTFLWEENGLTLHRGLQFSDLGRLCFAYVSWVRAFACMSVIPAVYYMSTGLAGCLMGPKISRSVRKLTRTSRVIKKKKKKRRRVNFH